MLYDNSSFISQLSNTEQRAFEWMNKFGSCALELPSGICNNTRYGRSSLVEIGFSILSPEIILSDAPAPKRMVATSESNDSFWAIIMLPPIFVVFLKNPEATFLFQVTGDAFEN